MTEHNSYAQVLEFHETFGHIVRDTPSIEVPERELRRSLIGEELEELMVAAFEYDLTEIADALGDLVYVIDGAALTFGLDEPKVVSYPAATAGRYAFMLNEAYSIFNHAMMDYETEDPEAEYTGLLLEMMKSLCYAVAEGMNIPLDEVITVIHESNMSKLGADGKPIYRESDNKVLKGENYFPPTPKIQDILERVTNEASQMQEKKGTDA